MKSNQYKKCEIHSDRVAEKADVLLLLASRVDFGAKCYTYNELVGLDVGVRGRRISTRQLSRQMSPHIHT